MMPAPIARILAVLALTSATAFRAGGQAPSPAPAGPRIEPGLETAVRWIWKVAPSPPGPWGLALPPQPPAFPPTAPGSSTNPNASAIPRATLAAPAIPANAYTVKRGDALFLIGRRFKVPVPLLKEVNGLSTDNIRVGQVLRIPSPEEVRARAPAPISTPAALRRTNAPAEKRPDQAALETIALQVFLDRAGFSTGPINGQDSPVLQGIAKLYRDTHAGAKDDAALRQLAQASGDPFTIYTIKADDFRFIAPPRAARAEAGSAPASTPAKKSRSAAPALQPQAKPTYQELTSAATLVYRTPWEFVAERFHCDEGYLRQLNSDIRDVPAVGTELKVPNVIPFAIERAFNEPLQPAADPQRPVTAAVVDLSRLEISQDGRLVAVMPLSMARPGLRGRDAWTIWNAIPRPRLVTEQELRVKPQAAQRIFGRDDPNATPAPARVHIPVEQVLPAGPNNPIGIIWINLTKAGSTEPLPYGLHGTSIPDHMQTQESLGGLRLTNWDIARAARLLPPGTALEWKQAGPVPPAPAARPAL